MSKVFENETYEFEAGEQVFNEYSSKYYDMATNIYEDESCTDGRRRAQLNSSNSLAPLLSSGPSDPDFIAGFGTAEMSQPGNYISAEDQPPLPPTKHQPRVFSKKSKGVSQGPVPIPGIRNRVAMDRSRSQDSGGLEMSTRGSADSGLRGGSLESPTTPPEWCLSRPFHNDNHSGEDQNGPCPYLTPLDSPTSTYPGIFPFSENHAGCPPIPTGEFTSPLRDRAGTGEVRRFDSGVGDSESEHESRRGRTASDAPSSTSASSSYPRLSRLATHYEQHYEDIDAYRQHTQPSTGGSTGTRGLANGGMSNGRPRLPRMDISGVTDAETDDHVSTTATSQNLRVRPNVDPRSASLPHTYSHLETNGYAVGPKAMKSAQTRSWCCCMVVGLVLIFLMSATALGLGVYLLLNDGHESSPVFADIESVDNLKKIMADLQTDMANLRKENENLKAELENVTSSVREEAQPFYTEISQLRLKQSEAIQSITEMNVRLSNEIADISLTPGPQGVANFSLCVHRSSTQSSPSSSVYPTESPYLPSDEEIQDHVLIFAYCSMEGAQNQNLELKSDSPSSISSHQYKCVCTGQVAGKNTTRCKIHAILCPKLQMQRVP